MDATKTVEKKVEVEDQQKKTSAEEEPEASPPAAEREKSKTTVRIFPAWCKGCGICAAFCPKGVLEMDPAEQKAVVRFPDLCVACGMCELRCPDLAIDRIVKRTESNNGKK